MSKCNYCDFYSITTRRTSAESFVAAALEEMKDEFLRYGISSVPTVYVGGGTPSSIGLKALDALLSGIAGALPHAPEEWTVEANPESVDEGILSCMRASGVGRLSLGVQSLDAAALAVSGRPHGPNEAVRALRLAVRAGFSVSCDLIAGLPGSNAGSMERAVEIISGEGASHVSAYALTVEEGTPFASRNDLPDEDAVARELDEAGESLEARGYRRYEVSNWALPGFECAHNLVYWRMGSWIAVGPSASQTLRLPGGRAERTDRSKESIAWRSTRTILDTAACAFETLMMGLRTVQGVDLEDFYERFGIPVEGCFPRTIARHRDMLEFRGRYVGLRGGAFDFMNRALVDALDESTAPDFPLREKKGGPD